MTIRFETPHDAAAIEDILDRSFAPGRERKTAYRLRDGVAPIDSLSFVNTLPTGAVAATLRFWPIALGWERVPALLLGPLAVDPALQGLGFGKALMRHGLAAAAADGHRIVVLVGDPGYYEPFGFSRAMTRNLSMPGPVEAHRFLARELVPGALDGVQGMIQRAANDPGPVLAARAGAGATPMFAEP
ncbi:putative N-acetyltransferase YhbS [Stella humosa]|uniref:Putative N-acetyltransferase YhbS n=1 Tax=Stella humosa TaxID=94 RepID=A0A3N1M1W9_9PROT|nr:N-acetyltransferase [Stella humosa]ROQ01514.1 putative N-acetyltransferase YhbS [Stella humosa]BBK31893.1 N-acetyltransferase [Stella humosa]